MNHEKNASSDEILMARVARGDRDALEILYDRHAPAVLGILLRIVGEPVTAEELLQETFWQLWQNVASFSSQNGSLSGWLFQIARNLATASGDRGDVPARDIMEHAKSAPRRGSLDGIPHEQRQVIEMAYFYGMTRQQIADATGETLETVQTLARLGLEKLAKQNGK
jgi:RNA polymerase sigma-70 factor (ECF subfamily)